MMYILDEDKNPVKCYDFEEWGKCLNDQSKKIVAQDYFGEVCVSTVFLGIDHSFDFSTAVLFETMIFGGKEDGYQDRYYTWNQALVGHEKACEIANHDAIERNKKLEELGID